MIAAHFVIVRKHDLVLSLQQQDLSKNTECDQYIQLVFLLIFFFFWFQLKDFETDETKRRIKKTKEEIFNNVKDSIMIEETVNKDFKKRRTV